MYMVDAYIELNKFNNIKFQEDIHKYYRGNKELISTTTFIKKFISDFDTEYWTTYKALKDNGFIVKFNKQDVIDRCFDCEKINMYKEKIHLNDIQPSFFSYITPETYKKQWEDKANVSSNLGSNVHSFIEFNYANKIYKPADIIDVNRYENAKKQYLNFYNKSKNVLIPVKSEIVIADELIDIAGMIDQLFWNTKYKCYQVWDWKTNLELSMFDRWNKMLSIFSHLDECDFTKYSLQLNIYKHILLRNTNLNMGDCYVVHLDGQEGNDYKIHKMLDLQPEVTKLFSKLEEKKLK